MSSSIRVASGQAGAGPSRDRAFEMWQAAQQYKVTSFNEWYEKFFPVSAQFDLEGAIKEIVEWITPDDPEEEIAFSNRIRGILARHLYPQKRTIG